MRRTYGFEPADRAAWRALSAFAFVLLAAIRLNPLVRFVPQ
jgi:hypothetical protein